MSYLILNKRQKQGKLIACCNFKDGSFVNLIRLEKPYKDGTKYSVYETTNNPFCSNGLFKQADKAFKKYNLMVKNNKDVGILFQHLLNRFEVHEYLNQERK